MSERRVPRRVSGSKSGELTREMRKVHGEELNDPYFSRNIVRVIKLRTMKWAVHVARMGERSGLYRGLVG